MAAALSTTKAVGAVRFHVDDARGELLAGARRAADQDAAVGRRDALQRVAQLVDMADLPIISAENVERSRRSRTSRFSCEASSARKATSTRRSALNGFSM